VFIITTAFFCLGITGAIILVSKKNEECMKKYKEGKYKSTDSEDKNLDSKDSLLDISDNEVQ